MRYFYIGGTEVPKHCIYGPRPRQGVFLTNEEWWDLHDPLLTEARLKEFSDWYLSKELGKKETSLKMTRNWQNTLASIKTQSEQKRAEKREKEKQDRIDQYNRIMESRKEEKKSVLAQARNVLFEMQDTTRAVVSALVQSAVLTEREKQVEFKKYLDAEQEKKEKAYVETIKQDVEDYKREQTEIQIRKKEAQIELKRSLDEQVESNRRKYERTIGEENKAMAEDVVKMMEANKKLSQCAEKARLDDIKRTKMNYEKGFHVLELAKSKAMEEEEENVINEMILKYQKKYAQEKARKEISLIQEAISDREKITALLSIKKKDEKQMEEGMDKATREKDEEYEKREKEKREERSKAQIEMKKWQKEREERVCSEKKSETEALKWSMLQQERRNEVDRSWREAKKRKAAEEKLLRREILAKQIKEKIEIEEQERKRDSIFVTKGMPDRDRLLSYCQEALDYAKKRGWKEYPLQVTLSNIKKDYDVTEESDEKGKKRAADQNARRQTEGCASCGPDYYCFRN